MIERKKGMERGLLGGKADAEVFSTAKETEMRRMEKNKRSENALNEQWALTGEQDRPASRVTLRTSGWSRGRGIPGTGREHPFMLAEPHEPRYGGGTSDQCNGCGGFCKRVIYHADPENDYVCLVLVVSWRLK